MKNKKISAWLLLLPVIGALVVTILFILKCHDYGKPEAKKKALRIVLCGTGLLTLAFVCAIAVMDSMIVPSQSIFYEFIPVMGVWAVLFLGITSIYADRILAKQGLYRFDLYSR